MSVILAYIPVLHQGYYQLFIKNPSVKTLYILSNEIASTFTPVHKEIRALDQELIISAIKSWNIFDDVQIADHETLETLVQENIIIPDEVVTNEVITTYGFTNVTRSTIFLRWDKKSAVQENPVSTSATISSDKATKHFIQTATDEGNKSSDWWRQVGAVAVRDNQIIAKTHNTHLPSEQQPYAESDPRAHFHKGDHIELTTAIHAEAQLIAEAAARGISLTGTDLYVTDFPCPVCAKLIAHTGIKKVFFAKGYSLLDGERVLRSKNIEIIRVIS